MEYLFIILITSLLIVYYCKNRKTNIEDPESSDASEIIVDTDAEKPSTKTTKPYKKRQLLTKSEYIFYGILKKKCDAANLLICPKVRLEDFVLVTSKNEKLKYRGYIKSRHVDFLICDSKLKIVAAIELDDKSHRTTKAKKTDAFKNELYETIGIPLHRIKVGENYNDKIDEFIKTYTNTTPKQNSTKPST